MTREEFVSLYKEYVKDIAPYNPMVREIDEEHVKSIAEAYYDDPSYDIGTIRSSSGNPVGFFVVARDRDNTHPQADYNIEQTYVKRKHRRHGYAFKYLRHYIDKHPGTYTYDILDDNIIAKLFWRKVFTELKATQITLPEVREVSKIGPITMYSYVA